MRSVLARVIVVVGVGLVAVAGCTAKEGGTAAPTSTEVGSAGTDTRTPGPTGTVSGDGVAPKVANPLDASKYLAEPCAAMSSTRLKSFSISKPGRPKSDNPAGPGCDWFTDDAPPRTFDVGFVTSNESGLSDIYRGGRQAFPGYFEPTEVDGYPAVFADAVNSRADGSCQVFVGISDKLAFAVSEQGDSGVGMRSCDDVKQFAGAVVKTLKEA